MKEALDETRRYLESERARATVAEDPYWPKWDSPWWRMLLLHEMGLAREIPSAVVEGLVTALATKVQHFFPIRAEEIPPGADPYRSFPCHCQLGCVYQVLAACGVDVDARLPWIRPWFLKWQLPDGGLNCDEAVYTKPTPRSSIVSTLPVLEAVLLATRRPFTDEEVKLLDAGARYLIERRLWRSVSKGGAPIDEAWTKPCFPRFYHYDILRGLTFLRRWSKRLDRPLPESAVAEAKELLAAQLDAEGRLAPGRRAFEGAKTRVRDASGAWVRGESRSFELLDAVSAPGVASSWLTAEWRGS
ncbi:MAG: hypothetical protein ACAI25_21105 [Planctomycetota bacterium]